jgi:hypothetical protein
MKPATRAALKLPDAATDADGAAALAKDGHGLTLRGLEKSDAPFVDYLRKEKPATYARLYKAEYGKEPAATASKAAPATKPTAETGKQAKVKLAGLGATVTLRQLEKEHPTLVLELRRHAPEEYSRLYLSAYGKLPAGMSAPGEQAPAEPAEDNGQAFGFKTPMRLTMGQHDPEVAAELARRFCDPSELVPVE